MVYTMLEDKSGNWHTDAAELEKSEVLVSDQIMMTLTGSLGQLNLDQ